MRITFPAVSRVEQDLSAGGVFRGADRVSMAGEAFAYAFSLSGTTNIPVLQLYNPVGSGITILLDSVYHYSASGHQFVVFAHQGAYGSDVGTVGNKLLGGANPKGVLNSGDILGPTGIGLVRRRAGTNENTEAILDPAVAIPEGWGVHVQGTASALNAATFQWREV